MRAVAVPMADPQLEFHWIPDPGFLIQGFLIQCLHRIPSRESGNEDVGTAYGGALDKETLDKESRVWEPVELQLLIGRGYRHRPHRIRNPPGSEASLAHSLSNAPTVPKVRAPGGASWGLLGPLHPVIC